MFPIESLFIEYLSHLGIYSAKLLVVAIFAEGVGTFCGFLVALKGHGGFAVVVVGAAQKVVGQEAVVGCAVIVEELDIRLHIGHREGLVVAIALINAVQTGTHTDAVGLRRAAGQRQQKGEYYNQILHHSAKVRRNSLFPNNSTATFTDY